MAEKSADVICEGKAVHRDDSLWKGFASDALAWQREEMPWFVGKDVAAALGYSNHRKALIDHVAGQGGNKM